MTDGYRYERKFVNVFDDADGWWAQRAAASGSGRDADLPDVSFARAGWAFAGEQKTTQEAPAYVTVEEVDALRRYAMAYGMVEVLILRVLQEPTFYLFAPDDVHRTPDAGSYRLEPENASLRIAEPETRSPGQDATKLTGEGVFRALDGDAYE